MDKETARLLFMDYMYDELDPGRRTELEQYLEKYPELKDELQQLGDVRQMLTHLQSEDPAEQLVMMEPDSAPAEQSGFSRLLESLLTLNSLSRAAFATAFMVLLFFITGALTDMNFSIGSEGFALTFGEQAPAEQGISPEQVQFMLDEVKEENARLMADLLEASRQQQEEQFQLTLASFADYINDQRYTDMQLLSSGLSSMEQAYYDRFRQTDQVLGEIIQTVSSQN
ncbi:anti-sigma factor [Balneola sp. MJW-20]|uniref:anti-sigma factor n=1 Tax=Gracilimonas aurantiaca TaxID=3234185 RepID=UPI0034677F15